MNNKDVKKILVENIIRYRKKLGYTQEAFSEMIEYSPSGLSDIETGKNLPRSECISLIAEKLNVELYELFIEQDSCVNIDTSARTKLVDIINKSDDAFVQAIFEYAKLLKNVNK